MSSTDDEVRELVSIATLGEGILRDPDEHRIMKVLLTAGFSPREAREKVDAALRALGVERAVKAAPPVASASSPAPDDPTPAAPVAPGAPKATPEAIKKTITRSFQRPTRRKDVREPSDEAVLAELVAPGPDDTTRWSGVCSSCLIEISNEDVRSGRAEVSPGGKRHCRACLSKLRAGLLCKVCYKPIERAALLEGRAQLHADRAVHVSCLAP